MEINDIEGSRPAKKKNLDMATRDLMNIKDIEGTTASPRHFHRGISQTHKQDYSYNPMDYRDVTNVHFKTKRQTNPLMPTYTTRDEDGGLTTIGVVTGSLPNVLPPARQDTNF